jgi:hypothetical protein
LSWRRLPDLTTPARMLQLAVAVAVIASAVSWLDNARWLNAALGDTDDATRLVMVRELLAGRGWWDQHWLRLQPPVGVYMHWSRLLDGGLAALTTGFRLFLNAKDAEYATRVVWPGLWIIPAAWATLVCARTLAISTGRGDRAQPTVIAATLLLLVNTSIYASQFHSGRVDHHNAQIALTLVALAGALQPSHRRGWAVGAGIASGVGLAIGLEALFFHALIAGLVAFRFILDPASRRFVRSYVIALAASATVAQAIQTPPDRWLVSVCDAMGVNLVAALVAGAALLAPGMWLSRTRDSRFRALAVGVAGLGAIAAYVGLDRNCLHGPFADVDPRIRAIWLDHVNEVANWFVLHHRDPERAVGLLTAAVLGIGATLALLWQRGRALDGTWWTTVLVFALGLGVGGLAARMTAYPLWFEIPPLAVAAGLLAQRYERGLASFAAVGAALLLTPDGWSGISQMAVRTLTPKLPATAAGKPVVQIVSKPAQNSAQNSAQKSTTKPRPKPKDYCLNGSSYDVLARAPKGLTVSEIDLGPFVLAHTPSSSLSGPYHRLSWGIMAARSILSAPDPVALQRARSLGVTYVLECPVHRDHADRAGLPADALQARLDRGAAPDWLQAMTPLTAPVVIYRIVDPSPRSAAANTQ